MHQICKKEQCDHCRVAAKEEAVLQRSKYRTDRFCQVEVFLKFTKTSGSLRQNILDKIYCSNF